MHFEVRKDNQIICEKSLTPDSSQIELDSFVRDIETICEDTGVYRLDCVGGASVTFLDNLTKEEIIVNLKETGLWVMSWH